MHVFLTGATGYIGSALLRAFLNNGSKVTALVSHELSNLPEGVEQIVCNLSRIDDLKNLNLSLYDCV